METAAYYAALLTIVLMPPVILYWLLIHSFIAFWRRIGPLAAYGIIFSVIILAGVTIYWFREPLLRIHFGFRWPLAIVALVCLCISLYLRVQLRRRFPIETLVGFPELSPRQGDRRFVTEGIYAKIRHPRYVEGVFVLATLALLSNYLATYVILALYIPAIYLVVLLEERELRKRFGAEYDDYCRKTPRFIPRWQHDFGGKSAG